MATLTNFADNINNELGGSAIGDCIVVINGVQYRNFLSLTLRTGVQPATCEGTIVLSWPGAEQFNRRALYTAPTAAPAAAPTAPTSWGSAAGIQGLPGSPSGPALQSPAQAQVQANQLAAAAFIDGGVGEIMLDGQLAASITFHTRISKGSPTHYELTLQFRGKTSKAVDTSPDSPDTGQMNNVSPLNAIQQLTSSMGFNVIDMSGKGAASQIKRFIVADGETAERAARRISRDQMGVQMFENEQGNWVLLGVNQLLGAGAGDIIVGRNVTNWSVTRNLTPRMSEVWANLKRIPTDQVWGGGKQGAEQVFANPMRSFGANMPGANGRLKSFLGDGDHQDGGTANAENEILQRSQQGLSATVRMSTWSDTHGQLWRHGYGYHTVIDVDGVNATLKCQEVVFELTPESRSATLTLVGDQGGTGGYVNVGGILSQRGQQWQPGQEQTPQAQTTLFQGGQSTPEQQAASQSSLAQQAGAGSVLSDPAITRPTPQQPTADQQQQERQRQLQGNPPPSATTR